MENQAKRGPKPKVEAAKKAEPKNDYANKCEVWELRITGYKRTELGNEMPILEEVRLLRTCYLPYEDQILQLNSQEANTLKRYKKVD